MSEMLPLDYTHSSVADRTSGSPHGRLPSLGVSAETPCENFHEPLLRKLAFLPHIARQIEHEVPVPPLDAGSKTGPVHPAKRQEAAGDRNQGAGMTGSPATAARCGLIQLGEVT
jgi:hypothetical protein